MELSLDQFIHQLLSLDRRAIWETFQGSAIPPLTLIESLIGPALERIGVGWEDGRFALSQVYMSGRICEELLDTFLPPGSPERRTHPKIALTTLADHHLLGKRIVYSTLRANGYEVLDYGQMGAPALVERVLQDEVEVVLISTLMLPSALRVKAVRDRLPARVKIIVGGAPFRLDAHLWEEVDADAMGYNASDALPIIRGMNGGGR